PARPATLCPGARAPWRGLPHPHGPGYEGGQRNRLPGTANAMGGATEVTNDIIVNPPAAVRAVEDLVALAAEINAEHQAGEEATRRGLEHYHRAGLKLLEAKKRCGHGNWLPWLKKHCPGIPERTARRYMRFAESATVADSAEAAWLEACNRDGE